MNKLIDNDKIYFKNIILFILDIFFKSLKYGVYAIILFIFYFYFIKSSVYSSKISFYANYSDVPSLSSVSLLSSLTGSSGDSNELGFSVKNYITSKKLLEEIVLMKYQINDEELTLVDYWGKDYNKIFSLNPLLFISNINRSLRLHSNISIEDRKLLYATEVLKENLSHSEDRKSSLHTIRILVENHPNLAQNISNNIFHSIINYSSEVTNIKAKEKKLFINNRLSEVKENLEIAENNMLEFLNNNKNLSSPSLMLKRDRIDRDLNLYNQLYISLSDQLEVAKIDEKDTTSSLFILDEAYTSKYKQGTSLIAGIIQVFLIIYFIYFFNGLYKFREELFQ